MAVLDKRAEKSCQNLAEDLVLYYYGELAGTTRRDCETHLNDCAACRAALANMGKLLPMTPAHDEPPPAFWDDYSREMRQKLDAASEQKSWWRTIALVFRPAPIPGLAAIGVLLLILGLTLGKGFWQKSAPAPDDAALMEVLPMAEQLDFFSNMELLDNLELLETMGRQGNGAV